MDNSGTQGTNTTTQTSPFAPVDIPDVNSIPAPSAMPPMSAMPPAGGAMDSAGMPDAVAQQLEAAMSAAASAPAMPSVDSTQQSASGAGQDVSKPTSTTAAMPAAPKVQSAPQFQVPSQKTTQAASKPASVSQTAQVNKASTATKTSATSNTPKVTSTPKPTQPAVKDVEMATVNAIQMPTKKPSVTIEPLLEECIRQNASDLHLQAGLPPILRIDGALRPIASYPAFDNSTVQELVFSTLDADQKVILMKDKEFDYSFAFGDLGRFRVNAFQEKGNMAAAFRLIPNMIKSIKDLGLPAIVEDFANHPNGLVLVTGPTGSGKSTTLAALIDQINSERADHIITIEDPIEFTHQSKRSLVAQREVHYDTYSFATALRSILREDPDVVLIGEMRDLETIQAAITVAETGHLVFATLHTNSAAQSIDRMTDVFPAHQQPQIRAQLANILVGICSQRLVPAIDGGRVAVTEILVTNSAVQAIIREGKTHQLDMTIQTGASQGMQTMDRELAKYVKAGIIAYDVAKSYAVNTAEFDRLARG